MKKEIIFDIKKIRILSVILTILIAFILVLIRLNIERPVFYFSIRWHMIIYIVFIVFAHEGFHGIGFRYIGKSPWKNISYGIHRKYLTPYCVCRDSIMTKRQYLGVLLLPNIILSIITLIIMIKSYNLTWTLFATFVIVSGVGDYYMAIEAMKCPEGVRFKDHPTEPGFYIYY
mgnify:CR=1 FL=1